MIKTKYKHKKKLILALIFITVLLFINAILKANHIIKIEEKLQKFKADLMFDYDVQLSYDEVNFYGLTFLDIKTLIKNVKLNRDNMFFKYDGSINEVSINSNFFTGETIITLSDCVDNNFAANNTQVSQQLMNSKGRNNNAKTKRVENNNINDDQKSQSIISDGLSFQIKFNHQPTFIVKFKDLKMFFPSDSDEIGLEPVSLSIINDAGNIMKIDDIKFKYILESTESKSETNSTNIKVNSDTKIEFGANNILMNPDNKIITDTIMDSFANDAKSGVKDFIEQLKKVAKGDNFYDKVGVNSDNSGNVGKIKTSFQSTPDLKSKLKVTFDFSEILEKPETKFRINKKHSKDGGNSKSLEVSLKKETKFAFYFGSEILIIDVKGTYSKSGNKPYDITAMIEVENYEWLTDIMLESWNIFLVSIQNADFMKKRTIVPKNKEPLSTKQIAQIKALLKEKFGIQKEVSNGAGGNIESSTIRVYLLDETIDGEKRFMLSDYKAEDIFNALSKIIESNNANK